ncbi:MAG TPA: hypothetical protein VGL48_10730 [Acidimicrobiales bacterium]|jgi:hypothetical protein
MEGLKGFWATYFTARAAPLGRVGAGPVAAAFYNFHPAMVERAVPACWDALDPVEVTVRRATAASEALRAACSDEALGELVAALPELRAAAGPCTSPGRVLGSANSALWASIAGRVEQRGGTGPPGEVAEAWQACTALREHRGDGHVAALVAHRISGLGAHLLAAGVAGVPADLLRDNRGWSAARWDEDLAAMADRGLLEPDGRATVAGRALHDSIETMTDVLAEPAYAELSDREVNRLYGAVRACAEQVQAAGLIPFPNPMGLPALQAP